MPRRSRHSCAAVRSQGRSLHRNAREPRPCLCDLERGAGGRENCKEKRRKEFPQHEEENWEWA